MINGDGPTVGEAMSKHKDIDMMSFTGSTRAGISVAKASAEEQYFHFLLLQNLLIFYF